VIRSHLAGIRPSCGLSRRPGSRDAGISVGRSHSEPSPALGYNGRFQTPVGLGAEKESKCLQMETQLGGVRF
jgi:hypothetical protein